MNNKNIFRILCAGALSAALLTACGGQKPDTPPAAESDNSLQYILDKGALTIGLDDQLPPMGFLDENGKIVGFDIDVAQKVCERLGVELETQPINWDSKQMELDTKSIDAIWNGLSWSEERASSMSLSIPYLKNHMVLAVPVGSSYETVDDLADKTISLQSGSTAQEAYDGEARLKDRTKMVGMENNLMCLIDVESGASDAALMDETVANYLIQTGGKELRIMEDFLYAEDYVVGFRKDDTALTEAINKALQELSADGTLAEISKKWFGADITTVAPAPESDTPAA